MLSASLYTILFNLGALCLVLGALLILWRLGKQRSQLLALGLGIAVFAFLTLLIFGYTGSRFGLLRLAAWVCFVHCPVYFLGLAVIFRDQAPQIATGHVALAGIIIAIGFDAWVIEPHWLEVTRMVIGSPKINAPVRVVVIADIQTDHVGAYEERVMAVALAQEPDLLLFAGDYIQIAGNNDAYRHEIEALHAVLKEFDLDVSLGAYAIAGNVDMPELWSQVFEGLPVVVIRETAAYDLGMVTLTGLTLSDSFNTRIAIPPGDGFHIVLGHSPNYSLGDAQADLLLAGHTHGGQVQLPFIGPLFTLSSVPRMWASGVTEISPGKTLVVSRGVGLERLDAPRMRFLCRPEIIVINLVPA
jgi:predicted MPP superfamily phosphohydrolase